MGSIFRWSLFVLILLLQAGAFLEGEWLAWIGGAIFCVFLTVSPSQFRAKYSSIPYVVIFLGCSLIFIILSYFDMKNGF